MGLSPFELYRRIKKKFGYSFLLESAEGNDKLARFSVIGFAPFAVVSSAHGMTRVNGRKVGGGVLETLRLALAAGRGKSADGGFEGGAVGYFSYDFVRSLEKLPSAAKDSPGFPDAEFGIFEDCIIFDHLHGTARYLSHGRDRLQEVLQFARKSAGTEKVVFSNPVCRTRRAEFENAVKKAKEKILSGEIFQVVLSKRYEARFSGDLSGFYAALKELNPSPYMFYLSFGKRAVIGSSPENLVRVEGDRIDSFATIAGTRKRGGTPEEDRRLERELLADKKELAEHLMLVDLTRNDLGKVSKVGSVKVPALMEVHKYSHVQHMASQVAGRLADGKDCFDAFRAIFPAGTVSGAPKIRAMELIDALEGERRGPYAGAVGYFSFNGCADFAICIRSLFADGKKAYIQTGAGIVHDSVPAREYEETESKARAMLLAMKNASEGGGGSRGARTGAGGSGIKGTKSEARSAELKCGRNGAGV